MSLDVEGINKLEKQLQKLSKAVGDKKTKRRIVRKGAKPIVDTARNIAPKLKKGKSHFRYDTTKLVSGLRAPKGKGNRIAEYMKGNLAGAIRVLSLRKSVRAILGPKVSKRSKSSGRFGPGTRRFDAYYAQMVFGSAKAFQRKVMISALQQKRGQAVEIIGNETAKVIKKNT